MHLNGLLDKTNFMKNVIILFAGAISSLSMAPTNFWPILFLTLSYLYIRVISAKTPFSAAIAGFLFSLGYFGLSLYWVGNALLIKDNPYYWAWPLAVSGLPVLLSLFTLTGCYIYKLLFKNMNNVMSYIAFVTCLFLSEYARGHLLTGFPWNLYGYTWIDVLPIAQIASLSTIYLLTLTTMFWACAPGFLLISEYKKNSKIVISIILSASIIISYMYGINRIHNNPTQFYDKYNVVIVQPNIEQSEKWKPENRAKNFRKQINLSYYKNETTKAELSPQADIVHYIVWPETSVSQDVINTPWVRNTIRNMLNSYPGKSYLITGALLHDQINKHYYNSIIIFNNNAEIITTYNKHHLVPFGEYMPFDDVLKISPIVGFSGFKSGSGQETLKTPEGLKFLPYICYEIIFPDNKDNSTSPPDVLLNATNDGWYGDSSGPYQHLTQAKFRAIETGAPLLRSANTGISAIVSPLGNNLIPEVLLNENVYTYKLPRRISDHIGNENVEIAIIWLLITFCTILTLYINLIKNSVLHRKLIKK